MLLKKTILLFLAIACCNFTMISAQPPVGKGGSYCTLAGKNGGSISKKELESVTKLEYVSPDSTFKVESFKLSVAGKDIEYKEFSSSAENLTPEMIEQLKQLPAAGCKIYIEYIRVGKWYGTEKITRGVAPLAFQFRE